jgi:hypothetical protein
VRTRDRRKTEEVTCAPRSSGAVGDRDDAVIVAELQQGGMRRESNASATDEADRAAACRISSCSRAGQRPGEAAPAPDARRCEDDCRDQVHDRQRAEEASIDLRVGRPRGRAR